MTRHLSCFVLIVLLGLTPCYIGTAGASDSSDPDQSLGPLKGSSRFTNEEFVESIVSGGPAPDGIPPIEQPVYESVGSADEWLHPEDRVFVVEGQEGVRLYPQLIMVYHEILNQEFNGRPGSLTYCPLVGVAIGYYADINDVGTTFGTSGKLVNNNLIMYDRQTGSYWPQILGEAITGAYESVALEAFPVYWATWEDAAAAYPDAEVLSRETGFAKPYGHDPYGSYPTERGYYFSDEIMFFSMNWDPRLALKRPVIGLKTSCGTAAFPKDSLAPDHPVLNFDVADAPVVAFYDEQLDTVRTFSRVNVDTVLTFAMQDGNLIDLNTGSVWTVKGRCVSGKWAGTQLAWIESMESFWFAWVAFYPETEFVERNVESTRLSP